MVSNQQQSLKQQKKEKPRAREISSGIIVFRKLPDGIRYLILYRGHNQWTFPRGKIEGEERSFAAALRETREETGLGRNDLHFVDYFKAYENWTFVKRNEKIHKTVILYLAETRRKQVRIEDKFEGYGWFSYEWAKQIFIGAKNDENRKILDLVHNFLTKNKKKTPT
ncbi:hypothetical protein A2755_01230 [Candidatus Wolfebacteria bacterium RIFCSPHIGHO2_01_FULL_48_22]|uniref:Nudix hydrolase domain-containing protein n=2 Tax=Candidatus Wolfeibacteriota TaxID=1752735 RepID=A0A1F8DV48_9BACT|nr:MAG: hypothetical protein A2755_01230 [Candidatus Wolfebacteria bacterium RIFCSPHIGHO2_01_FULL_48_22]OGM93923.1 MAG: hypothetical protein A2935_03565 [Candidatus Wolfebacteria bacterium RIFCSPLOWO2_01_FULL_47_17b]